MQTRKQATASGIMYFSSTFQLNNNLPSAQLTANSDIVINNGTASACPSESAPQADALCTAVFSIYTQCCTGCPAGACNNTLIPTTIVNKSAHTAARQETDSATRASHAQLLQPSVRASPGVHVVGAAKVFCVPAAASRAKRAAASGSHPAVRV